MADEGGKGGNTWLAFIVGGLIVVVAIVAWMMFSGGSVEAPSPDQVDVDVSLPEAPAAPNPGG